MMHFDIISRSAARREMAGVAAMAGVGGGAVVLVGAAAWVEWLVATEGGALAAVSAGMTAALMEAAEPVERLADVAAAVASGAMVAVGPVWAGRGGDTGALDVELGVPIGTSGWGVVGSVDWPEVGPGIASLSPRWYLAYSSAHSLAVQRLARKKLGWPLPGLTSVEKGGGLLPGLEWGLG